MPKISVIVPVYNTEEYLEKCIQSLLEQEYKDIEIIIVNDGTKDNSEQIILKYLEANKNIRYLKKENGGLSDARNYGVEKAVGEYISFVDSDDFVDKKIFSSLIPYMDDKIDLIKFKTKKIQKDKEELISGASFEVTTGEKAFHILYGDDKVLDSACLYLYKRNFWLEKDFLFTKGRYHEDFGLIPLVISCASTVVSTNNYSYCYLQRENSIVTNKNKEQNVKKAQDILAFYDELENRIKKYHLSGNAAEDLKIYYTNAVILKAEELTEKNRKEYLKKLNKRKLYKNIKIRNSKQFFKKILLFFSVELYLKLRKGI